MRLTLAEILLLTITALVAWLVAYGTLRLGVRLVQRRAPHPLGKVEELESAPLDDAVHQVVANTEALTALAEQVDASAREIQRGVSVWNAEWAALSEQLAAIIEGIARQSELLALNVRLEDARAPAERERAAEAAQNVARMAAEAFYLLTRLRETASLRMRPPPLEDIAVVTGRLHSLMSLLLRLRAPSEVSARTRPE